MAGNWQDSWWVGCAAEVVVAGGCGDDDLVRPGVEAAVDEFDVPAGHFADQVAALAFAASILQCGCSVVAVPGDVVDMSDRRITIGIPAGVITQPDEFSHPAVETATRGIAAHDRAGAALDAGGCGEQAA